MPVITFFNEHRSFEVDAGTNLRRFMLHMHITPYRGIDRLLNCRGHNFCGTCAVEIENGKGVTPRGQDEEATLAGNLAVARLVGKNMRLACQSTIVGDVVVRTFPDRPLDAEKTRQRFALIGLATFFGFVLAAMFVLLLLDMIKVM
ncbi:MAG: 2Fe-2S iron-sulfur cluster binding domain-containing protein [Ignavibacteriae bacterium]|nr:2Fe-2S iron-sulfur cluster binding domain-containing protein [Ignavibacteriota bacterium]